VNKVAREGNELSDDIGTTVVTLARDREVSVSLKTAVALSVGSGSFLGSKEELKEEG